MFSKMFALVLSGTLFGSCMLSAVAQDRSLADEPSAPKALQKYSPAAEPGQVGGLAATAAGAKLIVATQHQDGKTPRGGWALSLTVGEETASVFELAAKGYNPPSFKVKYLGRGGTGVNMFHYYQVLGYKAQMVIRNQATGGTYDQYIINTDTNTVAFYGKGFAYPLAN